MGRGFVWLDRLAVCLSAGTNGSSELNGFLPSFLPPLPLVGLLRRGILYCIAAHIVGLGSYYSTYTAVLQYRSINGKSQCFTALSIPEPPGLQRTELIFTPAFLTPFTGMHGV